MKIAITCDFLLEKNFYTEVIDLVSQLIPDAKIYTFAHRGKAISARIEKHHIQSTFLSKKIFSEKKFYQFQSFMLPSIAKKFFIPCNYDLVINLSHGLSQGFARCADSKQLTYLMNWNLENEYRNNIWQKFFFSYVKRFAKKSLLEAHYLWVPNEHFKEEFPQAQVVPPPFKMSDYALFPVGMFPNDYILIDTDELEFSFAQKFIHALEENKLKFKFIGKYSHLKDLVFTHQADYFYGDRCSGEHAPILAGSKMFISFSKNTFPRLALGTLSTGRPVILPLSQQAWLNGEGLYFFNEHKIDKIIELIKKVGNDETLLNRSNLREQVNKYQENIFINTLKEFIKRETV